MLKLISSFVLLSTFFCCHIANAESAPQPNVLFISIDDLNDWVGCLGGHPQSKTPHIDKLAKQGILFTNAHCQAPVCTSSRASMMTSRLPSSSACYFLQPHLHLIPEIKKSITMAERFQQEGYTTLGVGKVYGGHDQKYFETYAGKFGAFGPRPKKKINYLTGHPLWDWGAYPASDDEMPDKKAADWAIKQLDKKHDKPFFLGVGFHRPHVPMYAPQKWLDQHPLEKIILPKVMENDRDDLGKYAKGLTIGYPAPRQEWFEENKGQWEKAVQGYLASSTFADHHVGRVLAALAKSEYANNTVIVLFSDHGWHLGEKRRWAKRSLWEDSTRVPVIITAPGHQTGITTNRPVGLIDLYPTLLQLCGMKSDSSHEGQSLVPLMRNPNREWEKPVITTFGPHNHSLRSTNWRYIQYADGSEELYDHTTDPHEWHNLASNPKYKNIITQHKHWLPKVNKPALLDYPSSGLEAWQVIEKAAR